MRRVWCWLAYHIVTKWPGSVLEEKGVARIWWALLPYAGGWAHYWSEPPEYRRRMDERTK